MTDTRLNEAPARTMTADEIICDRVSRAELLFVKVENTDFFIEVSRQEVNALVEHLGDWTRLMIDDAIADDPEANVVYLRVVG